MGALIEDFNSYTDGDLNGQGSWSGATDFDVQGTITYEGAKAIKAISTTSNNVITKAITPIADGVQTFYIRAEQTDKRGNITLLSNNGFESNIGPREAGNVMIYYNPGGGLDYYSLGAYTATAWVKIDVEFRSSDSSIRGRINDGTWSAWGTTLSSWLTIDSISLNTHVLSGGTFYWDNFLDGGGAIFTKELIETITIVATYSVAITAKILSETITLVSSITKSITRAFSETIALVGSIVTETILAKILLETISLVSSFAKTLTATRIFTETVVLVDNIKKLAIKTLNEIITLVDTISSSLLFIKNLVENIVLNSAITKATSKVFNETITLVASFYSAIIKILEETITLVASFASLNIFLKVLTETISLVPRFISKMNGILTNFWGRGRKDTGDWNKNDRDFM